MKAAKRPCGAEHCSFGKKRKNSSSSFLGVSFHKITGKWTFLVRNNGKSVYLKLHVTELEAAKVYNNYVIEHGLPNPLNDLG